jgi:hypothetical protein
MAIALADHGELDRRCPVGVLWRKGESMSADRCRQLAADCLRLAQVTNEASEKALLLEMAERWRLLATQFEARHKSAKDDPQKESDRD